MGRKAKVSAPKTNLKDKLNPENIEMASRIMMTIGAGVWAYGQAIVARHSVKPVMEKILTDMSEPTNAILFTLCPTAAMIAYLPKYLGDIKKTQDKYSQDAVTLYSSVKPYTVARDAAQMRLDDARKNGYNKGDMTPYEQGLREAQDKLDAQVAKVNSTLDAIDDLNRGREALLMGKVLLASGLTLYLSSHPDIIKQAIDSMEKVTIRLIDESSEILESTAKLTEAGGKAIKDLLPDLWGLGW